jgi:hypothetical protein
MKSEKPKASTKDAKLMVLLARERGATRQELAKEVPWNDHSIRGWLSGLKYRGIKLMTKDEPRGRVYRISADEIPSGPKRATPSQPVRKTVTFPVETDQNLDFCRLKLRVSRNELINRAVNEFLIAQGFEPHRSPKDLSVSY